MEESHGTALWKACEEGQFDQVQSLLIDCQSNPRVVNFQKGNEQKDTPIHVASARGHTAVVELLLSHGAIVSSKDRFGNSPLVFASLAGKTEAMEVLLRHGADVNAKDMNGDSVLVLAIKKYRGDIGAVKVLLRHGAHVEAMGNDGQTPLMIASKNGCSEVMEALLQNGAALNAEDTHGHTPLVYAINNLRVGAVEILLRHGARVDSVGDQDMPLIRAIRNWDASAMEDWLHRNRDRVFSHTPYNQGLSLLQWAMKNDDYHFMSLLLKNGADIEAKDNSGMTPLHWASQNGRAKAMKVLLSHGAQIEAKNNDGYTPLAIASRYGMALSMEILLRNPGNRAQVDALDNNGMSPLTLASQNNHTEAIKVLLKYGASVHVNDQHGRNPLDYALLYLRLSHAYGDTRRQQLRLSTVYLLLRRAIMETK